MTNGIEPNGVRSNSNRSKGSRLNGIRPNENRSNEDSCSTSPLPAHHPTPHPPPPPIPVLLSDCKLVVSNYHLGLCLSEGRCDSHGHNVGKWITFDSLLRLGSAHYFLFFLPRRRSLYIYVHMHTFFTFFFLFFFFVSVDWRSRHSALDWFIHAGDYFWMCQTRCHQEDHYWRCEVRRWQTVSDRIVLVERSAVCVCVWRNIRRACFRYSVSGEISAEC